MYIKIEVDFLGIPRPVLPFTLGLNPGLPAHEQEAQRRMEVEKYKQLRAKLQDEINQNDQEIAERSVIPVRRQVSVGIRQQPPLSTTGSESIQCEDISDDG
jgi:hypothetical protein